MHGRHYYAECFYTAPITFATPNGAIELFIPQARTAATGLFNHNQHGNFIAAYLFSTQCTNKQNNEADFFFFFFPFVRS